MAKRWKAHRSTVETEARGNNALRRSRWHNPNWVESPVVNATVGTTRNVNCVTICRLLIAGLSQIKVLSRMRIHNLIALKIILRRQSKIGQTFWATEESSPSTLQPEELDVIDRIILSPVRARSTEIDSLR